MTERNEKSANFYESLTLRRNRECRISRFNRFDLNHSRKASQDQNKQSQSCDDHEKSIKIRQEFSEKRDQREKRVKNFEELVQFVRIKNAK
jgi:long-subunit acyl-CoA synthetase (AMP-forming)